MSLPPEKIGDKGQRYAISYILPDGTEMPLGYGNDPDAFKEAAAAWPRLKGATRKVLDRQTNTVVDTGATSAADPATIRAHEIYNMAWKRAGAMLAMYQVRKYPKTRVQGIPTYKNESDYEFFKAITSDDHRSALELTFAEWEIYLVALEKILADQGITTKRVMLTQHEFRDFVTEAESGQ